MTISQNLLEERRIYKKQRWTDRMRTPLPTHSAVLSATFALGLDHDRAEWLITAFAASDEFDESTVLHLLQGGYWAKLATSLYHDARELRVVLPSNIADDHIGMSFLISSLKEKFFSIDLQCDEDKLYAWAPTDDFRKTKFELRADPETKSSIRADLIHTIIKDARDKADRVKRQAELSGQSFQVIKKAMEERRGKQVDLAGIQVQIETCREYLATLYDKQKHANREL